MRLKILLDAKQIKGPLLGITCRPIVKLKTYFQPNKHINNNVRKYVTHVQVLPVDINL